MKAELKPLEGKYYGTVVEIFDDNDHPVGGLNLWLNPNRPGDYSPSERELEQWNEYWKQEGEEAPEYGISDNHYECALALEVANKIVEAING